MGRKAYTETEQEVRGKRQGGKCEREKKIKKRVKERHGVLSVNERWCAATLSLA